jgi:hypothetical protein
MMPRDDATGSSRSSSGPVWKQEAVVVEVVAEVVKAVVVVVKHDVI